jgi:uroporphyrinogen III methyltransferase / synthase
MTAASNQNNRPLANRTVVVVEPDKLSAAFLRELEGNGARVLTCPPVEIGECENYDQLDEALEHLFGYDWLLFTTVSGVAAFLRRMNEKGLDASALEELQVGAIGDETEKLLREEQVHVDVASASPRATVLFGALESFVGGQPALEGLNFLLPRGVLARDSLTRALNEAGARVDVVPAYRIKSSPEIDSGRTAALLAAAADYIVLAGPASLLHLTRLFDTLDLGDPLAEVLIGCFDAATAIRAQEHNLRVTVLPAPNAIAETVQVIARDITG